MKISILFDNRSVSCEFIPMWGFSCFIHEHNLLFDTGSSYKILKHNMQKLSVNKNNIKWLFLSHFHWDHIGGAIEICLEKRELEVFIISSFSKRFMESLKSNHCKVKILDEASKFHKCCISTGMMKGIVPEQGLIILHDKGPILITGCAHPGIVNMVKRTISLTGKKLLGVIGGFHLLSFSLDEILDIVYSLDEMVEGFLAPCHCTGDEAIDIFRRTLKDKFLEIKCGTEIIV